MRQFVFGLLVAVLLAWGYSRFGRDAAAGGAGNQEPKANESKVDLDAMVAPPAGEAAADAASHGSSQSNQPPVAPAPANQPPLSTRASSDPLQQALDRLVARLQNGDAAARGEADRLLLRNDLPDDLRAQLQAAVRAKGGAAGAPPAESAHADRPEDLEGILAQLGTNNVFLHTADGRDLAQRAQKLVAALGDEQALPVMTNLLERCMRGEIRKEQTQEHEFVDLLYAQYRVRADRFLCDPANLAKARSLTVGPRESLSAIAARFKKEGLVVEDGTLAILNRIHNMNAIQVGQRIKAPIEPIHVVVEKRSFLMAVYVGDAILRLYWVGHGADDKTPVTEFTVSDKIENPHWYAPDGKTYAFGDPKNILGKYFIKFASPSYSGFGAHGTPQPETIGTMASMGCIRMYDKDIEELFRLLPRRAKVEVRDSH